jgi:hypothetical protein
LAGNTAAAIIARRKPSFGQRALKCSQRPPVFCTLAAGTGGESFMFTVIACEMLCVPTNKKWQPQGPLWNYQKIEIISDVGTR